MLADVGRNCKSNHALQLKAGASKNKDISEMLRFYYSSNLHLIVDKKRGLPINLPKKSRSNHAMFFRVILRRNSNQWISPYFCILDVIILVNLPN